MRLAAFILIFALMIPVPSFAGGVTKEVCKTVAGKKVCKKIKVHKKLDGTKIPGKK